jgi:hypothetical protein
VTNCPLCSSGTLLNYHEDSKRTYFQCDDCFLVTVPPKYHLNESEEKREYDLHENSSLDVGYRQFLSRVLTPLINKIPASSQGLDFGCGNGPTLSKMFEEKEHTVNLFDKYYFNDPSVLFKKYDFITATEVIEHLSNPKFELDRLIKTLRANGWLGIMTKLVQDKNAFSNWHYKNDPTHICFYSAKTFEWIASKYDLNIEFFGNDVILLGR